MIRLSRDARSALALALLPHTPLMSVRFLHTRRCKTRVGDRVRFSLASVFLPDAQEADSKEAAPLEGEGMIMAFSDSGPVARVFAVVEIDQQRTVVVPVEELRLAPEEQSGKEPA
jgi:hypothetical protein